MGRKAFRLPFRLLGIPLYLDFTFLLVLPVFAWMIASSVDVWALKVGVEDHPSLHRPAVPYILGIVSAIGLFVSVILHELGHSVVARWYGVKVRSITLWLLGGVAEFEEMPRQRGAEAVVAIAGPIVSLALGAVFWVIAKTVPKGAAPATSFFLSYVALSNLVLAVFNMVPALPLDGGRVLRSLLALRMSHLRATQMSATISKVLAVGLGFYGIVTQNIWMLVLAFFIYLAVNAEVRHSLIVELLEGVGVRELMSRDVRTVSPDMTLADLAQHMLREHKHGFPVRDGDHHLLGVVSLDDMQRGTPEQTVRDVMQPVHTVRDAEAAVDAFQRMSKHQYARLIVTDARGEMVGIITKTDLLRAIEVRTLGMNWGTDGDDGTPLPAPAAPSRVTPAAHPAGVE